MIKYNNNDLKSRFITDSTGAVKEVKSVYVGSNKVWESGVAPFFAQLVLNDGSIINLAGSGELGYNQTSQYINTVVSAEIGTLCTSLGGGAFYGAKLLENIIIPDSVESVDGLAFYSNSSLKNLYYNAKAPLTLTSFTLEKLVVGDSVPSIGSYLFSTCYPLTDVTIGKNVTEIGYNAFSGCKNISSVTIYAMTPPTLGSNYVFNKTVEYPIYVPAESVDAYKTASEWSAYADRIQAIPTT